MINHYLQKVLSMLWNSGNLRIQKTMETISHSRFLACSNIQKTIASRKHDKPLPTTGFQHPLKIIKYTHFEKTLKTVSHIEVSACSNIQKPRNILKTL